MRYLFWVFIFLIPSQLGKHFWPEWSLVEGVRVDYLAPTVYLTDILLFLLAASILINHKSYIRNHIGKISRFYILFMISYILFIILRTPRPWLAVYWLGRYLEIAVAAKIMSLGGIFSVRSARNPRSLRRRLPVVSELRVSAGSSSMTSKMPPSTHLVLIGLAIAVLWSVGLGAGQMVLGRTTGWFWWLGERNFNLATPGIATMTILGREVLRPYAIFGHPNALGGFVAAATLLLLQVQSSKFKVQSPLLILIGIIGVGLTGSRGAIAALAIAALLKVQRSKFKGQSSLVILGILGILGGLGLLGILGNLGNLGSAVKFAGEAGEERLILAQAAGDMWKENWLMGVGPGQFLAKLPDYLPDGFWKIQPVHNIFLLALAEFGILGIGIMVITIIKIIKLAVGAKGAGLKWLPVLAVIFVTGMVDHYWLTAQQNRLLLGVILGLMMRIRSEKVGLNRQASAKIGLRIKSDKSDLIFSDLSTI